MHFRSETMRFSRENVDGQEQFTVTWLSRSESRPARAMRFITEAQFRDWLQRDQSYSPEEADDTIAQLRAARPQS